MMNILVNISKFISSREEKKLTKKTRNSAWRLNDSFEHLFDTIKEAGPAQSNNKKVQNDYERFLLDNTVDYENQNVSRNQNFKRAIFFLTVAMIISSSLAIKGLQFLFSEFYGPVPLLFLIIIALILSGLIVIGSIILSASAEGYRENKYQVFIIAKVAAIVLVLFVPMTNLFEGLNSHYTEFAMALNLFAVLVDIILNIALISMWDMFTLAENAIKAKKIISKKQREIQRVEHKANVSYSNILKSRYAFRFAAKKFISDFKDLQDKYPKATSNILNLLDNLTIFMINNKVFQHAILPYHTNEAGNPVVESQYFTSNGNSLSDAYDLFEKTTLSSPTQSRLQEPNNQEKASSRSDADQGQQDEPEGDEKNETPLDYETFLDDTNEDEKYL